MITTTALVDEVARALRLERRELEWRARRLKEAALITPGKRGKAATATSHDAAVLLIAALASGPGAHIAHEVECIGMVKGPALVVPRGERPEDREPDFEIAPPGPFLATLIALIDLYRHPDARQAELAGWVTGMGITESGGYLWPWLSTRQPYKVNDEARRRLVFSDIKTYTLRKEGIVRETRIGSKALYRTSAALGLEWRKAPPADPPLPTAAYENGPPVPADEPLSDDETGHPRANAGAQLKLSEDSAEREISQATFLPRRVSSPSHDGQPTQRSRDDRRYDLPRPYAARAG